MKPTGWVTCIVTSLVGLSGCVGPSVRSSAKTRERIGVYDSRAIAVAFAGSKAFNQRMSGLRAELRKAKEAGDQKRADELEAEGPQQQELLHKQGFSTAPVDDILEHIKSDLPAIKQKAGVNVLVSKWDKDGLARHPHAEPVDVTMALVDAFNPTERQRRSAIDIQEREPISLKRAENIRDW